MTLTHHLHHKSNPITTKWKPSTTIKHVLQDNSHTHPSTKYNTHQNHKPSPKIHPYPKPNINIKQKFNPKNKTTSTYQPHPPTNAKTHLLNKCFKNKPYPNSEHYYKIKHLLSPHIKYQPHPKNTMASAYRPRHTNNNKYHFINNWKPNSITSQKSTNNTKPHFSPIQIKKPYPLYLTYFPQPNIQPQYI